MKLLQVSLEYILLHKILLIVTKLLNLHIFILLFLSLMFFFYFSRVNQCRITVECMFWGLSDKCFDGN